MLTVNETRFDVLVTSALLPSGTKWRCYVMKNGIFFFVTATNVNKITSIVAVVSAMEQLFQEIRHLEIELVTVRLSSCSAADGSSGDELDEFELEPYTSETNSSVNHSMDCSINGDHLYKCQLYFH